MKYLTKCITVWIVINASQTTGIPNIVQQPSETTAFGNNLQTLKNLNAQPPQFETMLPFPPDYPIPAFPLRVPYESNDFNLQYQPQFMPPIRLDIQFMPPPLYRLKASRPFVPLSPEMSAPFPFVLAPLDANAFKNKTTSTISPDSETIKDDAKKNKTRPSEGSTTAPQFYVVEDTETKVIDTWRETEDIRYFSNKWWMGNAAKPKINYLKKSNLKHKNNVATTLHPTMLKTKDSEKSKKIKNMVRIVPLKKEILREVSEKLRQLKAQGKLTPLMRLLKQEYDKRTAINKILDFHTPLKEDKINFINK